MLAAFYKNWIIDGRNKMYGIESVSSQVLNIMINVEYVRVGPK